MQEKIAKDVEFFDEFGTPEPNRYRVEEPDTESIDDNWFPPCPFFQLEHAPSAGMHAWRYSCGSR